MSKWFYFIYEKMHLWNFGLFLFENVFMNAWFFLNAYIIYVWMIFLWENTFMKTWFFLIYI